MPVEFVLVGTLEALRLDYLAHPHDPIRLTLACFDQRHFDLAKRELALWSLPTKLFKPSGGYPEHSHDLISKSCEIASITTTVIHSTSEGRLHFERFAETGMRQEPLPDEHVVATEGAEVKAKAEAEVASSGAAAETPEEAEGSAGRVSSGTGGMTNGDCDGENGGGGGSSRGFRMYTACPTEELASMCGAAREEDLGLG